MTFAKTPLSLILNGTNSRFQCAASARIHAELYASLRQKGELIGAHDLVIEAIALQHGFAVLTGNIREFNRISGLTVLPFL
jgi:predicted nucleic acid-binding protein